jgi:hypothetical protein
MVECADYKKPEVTGGFSIKYLDPPDKGQKNPISLGCGTTEMGFHIVMVPANLVWP